jgi:hypothetical protein
MNCSQRPLQERQAEAGLTVFQAGAEEEDARVLQRLPHPDDNRFVGSTELIQVREKQAYSWAKT